MTKLSTAQLREMSRAAIAGARKATAAAAAKSAATDPAAAQPPKAPAKAAVPAAVATPAAAAPATAPAPVKAEADAKATPSTDSKPELAEKLEDLGEPILQAPPSMTMPPEVLPGVEQSMEPPKGPETPGLQLPEGVKDLGARVVDPASLTGQDVQFDMFPHVNRACASVSDVIASAKWLVAANGRPACEIALRDQDNAEMLANYFLSNSYATDVLGNVQRDGFEATMKAARAKPYVAVVDAAEKTKEITASLAAKAEESLRAARADLASKINENLDLALEAAVNNYHGELRTRDTIVAGLSDLGVSPAHVAEVVDSAFAVHAKPDLLGIVKHAQDLSNMPAEAFAVVKGSIQKTGYRRPALLTGAAAANPGYNRALASSLAAAAVPVVVAAVQPSQVVAPVLPVATPSAASEVAALRAKLQGR